MAETAVLGVGRNEIPPYYTELSKSTVQVLLTSAICKISSDGKAKCSLLLDITLSQQSQTPLTVSASAPWEKPGGFSPPAPNIMLQQSRYACKSCASMYTKKPRGFSPQTSPLLFFTAARSYIRFSFARKANVSPVRKKKITVKTTDVIRGRG